MAAGESYRATVRLTHAGEVFEPGDELPQRDPEPYEGLPGASLSSTSGHRRIRVPREETSLSPPTGHAVKQVPPRPPGFTVEQLEDLARRGLAEKVRG